jgi:polysaccharide biosynthesis transport protein
MLSFQVPIARAAIVAAFKKSTREIVGTNLFADIQRNVPGMRTSSSFVTEARLSSQPDGTRAILLRGEKMSLRQLIAILVARKWTVAIVTALTVATAAILSFVLPSRYVSTATVFIDLRALDRVGSTDTPLPFATSYMATRWLDIIRRQRVAQEVVQALGPERFEPLRARFLSEAGGRGQFEAWIGEQLLKELDVRPSRESSVIDVSFTAGTAKDAADTANAFATAYIDTQVKLRIDPAQRQAATLADRSKGLRDEVEKTQKKLSTFQRQKGLAVSDEKLDSEVARLDQLTKELAQAQAQAAEARARQRSAGGDEGGDPASVPEVLANPLVQSLKGELAKQEGKLRELDAKLGSAHPQYTAAAAEVESTRRRLSSEMRNVVGGVNSAATIAEAREARLRDVVAQQKGRVLELRQSRDQAGLISRDMEGAQKALDASRDRMTTSRLESQMRQSNVSILNQAVEPPKASFPKPKLNIALALVLGSLLGMGIALGREVTDQRVRSADDLRGQPNLPLLGTIKLIVPAKLPRDQQWVLGAPTSAGNPQSTPRLTQASSTESPSPVPPNGDSTVTVEVASEQHPAPAPDAAANAFAQMADGILTPEQVQSVVNHKRESRMSFVDAARSLNLVPDEKIHQLVSRQYAYPYAIGERWNMAAELVAAHSPFAVEVEALRSLRSQIMMRWLSTKPERRSLAIVGSERGCGRTFLAANLAVVFAQLGMRTLLVDADLRTPRVHSLFGIGGSIGLSSLLAGEHDPGVISNFAELPSLSILPAGATPPNPQELIGREAFTQLTDELNRRFDIILFDTPATDSCADAQLVAARSGGTVHVARSGTSRLKSTYALAADLTAVGAAQVGLVLNAA